MPDPGWVEIAQKLSGAGLATVLILIFIMGYKQVWVWGWAMKALEAREAEAVKRAEYWQNLYLDRVVPLEKTVEKLSGGHP